MDGTGVAEPNSPRSKSIPMLSAMVTKTRRTSRVASPRSSLLNRRIYLNSFSASALASVPSAVPEPEWEQAPRAWPYAVLTLPRCRRASALPLSHCAARTPADSLRLRQLTLCARSRMRRTWRIPRASPARHVRRARHRPLAGARDRVAAYGLGRGAACFIDAAPEQLCHRIVRLVLQPNFFLPPLQQSSAMLLNLFVAWLCPRVEAEALVEIVCLIIAPAFPFQRVVGKFERRLGLYVEHGRGGAHPVMYANSVPPPRAIGDAAEPVLSRSRTSQSRGRDMRGKISGKLPARRTRD